MSLANLLASLKPARKEMIQAALTNSNNKDVKDLNDIVAGKNIVQATSFFKEELDLDALDASALAGVLIVPAPAGKILCIHYNTSLLLLLLSHTCCVNFSCFT